jgi:site-specific recombinase XerD
MAEAYFDEAPFILKDFLSYMETIKGKSKNTIHEYYYDLRMFFRFIRVHKGLEANDRDFETIDIKEIDVEMLKEITLSDLYSFMSFLSRERDNNSSSRARRLQA